MVLLKGGKPRGLFDRGYNGEVMADLLKVIEEDTRNYILILQEANLGQ